MTNDVITTLSILRAALRDVGTEPQYPPKLASDVSQSGKFNHMCQVLKQKKG
jgi:hypothetical protein